MADQTGRFVDNQPARRLIDHRQRHHRITSPRGDAEKRGVLN
jgi:hypothetical protein